MTQNDIYFLRQIKEQLGFAIGIQDSDALRVLRILIEAALEKAEPPRE